MMNTKYTGWFIAVLTIAPLYAWIVNGQPGEMRHMKLAKFRV